MSTMQIKTVAWERLDIDAIHVKEHTQQEVKAVVSKRFENQQAYEQFVVTLSVTNLGEIVPTIRAYAKQKKAEGEPVSLEQLHHELYLLVCSINPLLRNDVSAGMQIENTRGGTQQHHSRIQKASGQEAPPCAAACDPVQEKRLKHVDHSYVLTLGSRMNDQIVGQNLAVDILTNSIITAFAGIKEPRVPVGNYIFIGNTGIGKTYTAQILADTFMGDPKALHRFDMSEYAEGHEYTKLIGAPSGYRGFEKGGILTNSVKAYPFCVILADEIEEAHEKTRKIFLHVMDEGRLTDGQGNEVEFGEATVIMTSNIGSKELERYKKRIGIRDHGVPMVTQRAKEDTLRASVEEFFPPKFLNRVDDIIYFRDLTWEEYLEVSKLELFKTVKLVEDSRSIIVTPSDEVVEWVRDNGCNDDYGARPLKRFIKKNFRLPLAKQILSSDSGIGDGDTVIAEMRKGKLIFEKQK